jgi:hypothetical protein
MAQRITERLLENLLKVAIAALQKQGLSVNAEYEKLGCILLDNCYSGYSLGMIDRDGASGVRTISDTMTAKEMYQFLQGIIAVGDIKARLDRARNQANSLC